MMNLKDIMKKRIAIGLTAMLLTSSFPVNVFAAEAEIPETELTGEVQTESEDEASVSEETADFEQFGAADDGKNMAGLRRMYSRGKLFLLLKKPHRVRILMYLI